MSELQVFMEAPMHTSLHFQWLSISMNLKSGMVIGNQNWQHIHKGS